MSSVLSGLCARRETTKKLIRQAIEARGANSSPEPEDDREDVLWDLQRQLESLHVQIAAYERAEAAAK